MDNRSSQSQTWVTTRGILALVLLPLFLVAAGAGFIYLNLLSQTEREAKTHSQNVSQLLANQASAFIRNHTHTVELLAQENQIQRFLSEATTQPDIQNVTPLLQRYCQTLGASICYLLNQQGDAIVDSHTEGDSIVGNNYGFRPYFKNAMQGDTSVHLALGVTTKKRGIYFSSPVLSKAAKPIGVAVIKYLPDQIEQRFNGLAGEANLVNEYGVVFASSKPDWLYKTLFPISPQEQQVIAKTRQFGDSPPDSIGFKRKEQGQVISPDQTIYLLESEPVAELPNWKITYLLPPEHFRALNQASQKRAELILLGLLMFITLLAIYHLYRQLTSTLQVKQHYQNALQESQSRLLRFERASSEAILVHNDDGIVDINERAEALFGYNREEFLALSPEDFFTSDSLDIAIQQADSGSEQPYQAAVLTKDHREIPVVITGREVDWNGETARAASFRDISKRIEAQRKLLASEDRFRQLSELVSEGLLIYQNHRVIDVNHTLCTIIGERREDIISSPLTTLFEPETLNQIAHYQNQGYTQPFEMELIRKDASPFPAEITIASMRFDDGLYTVLSIRDISRQKEQEEHILYQAQYDLLTHVPNRFLARDRTEQAMRNADRHKTQLALMFIDLDGFKKVNDSLGHDVGDNLLQQAAKRFQSCLKENHTLARHGGDEFLILLEDIHSATDAELIAEQILQQFTHPFMIQNKQLIVTTSIGISIYPDDASDYRSLLRAADIGMYKAKKDGRNTFHYYTQEMNDIATRQLDIDNNLRTAIQNNELTMVYQPLISGIRGHQQIIGAEALIRWHSDALGFVSPEEFIPITEQTGLIIPIGRWILKQTCQQARFWVDQGYSEFSVSVNVSPRQFKGNDFLSDLKHALEEAQLPAHHLNLEVTEGLLIEASTELMNSLREISDLGVKISMDDFGTGYSSLNYLKTFPFDNLKIDRSFINELPDNSDSKILVTATIAMAHQLGLSVTAEGIETKEQYNYLSELRCDLLQGYYFGKPMPAKEFTALLDSSDYCHS